MVNRLLLASMLIAFGAPSVAHAAEVEATYTPTAPDPRVQLAMDITEVPADKAAVFIPRLAAGHVHPDVTLVNGERVVVVPVGERVLVDPGNYVVIVGSADPKQSVSVPLVAVAGRTTLVPARWGALDLAFVRPRGKPVEGVEVVVRRASTQEVMALPDALEGQTDPSVLLLAPGLYEIESVAQGDVVSVHVPEGGLVRFVTTERPSGRFAGGRVVSPVVPEVDDNPDDGWKVTLVMGADASVGQTSGFVGVSDLLTASGSASLEVDTAYRKGIHTVGITGGLRLGAFMYQAPNTTSFPLVKTRDKLHLGLEYRVGFRKGLGLYARGGGDTQILPTAVPVTEPTTVSFEQLDGTVQTLSLGTNQTVRIADAFAPTTARAGVGLYGDLVDTKAASLGFRLGPAYRFFWFRGAYVSEDNPNTTTVEYRQVADLSALGAEGTVALALRASRVFLFETSVDVFVPFRANPDLIIGWHGGIVLNVGRGFSLQYGVDLVFAPEITSNLSLQQNAGVRWTFDAL